MYAFRDGDPDGTGENDTVAYAVTAAHRGIRPISGVDGWVYWWTYFEDGETRLGRHLRSLEGGTAYLSRWYADKLIPQRLRDFGYNDAWAIIGEGRSGIWTDGVGFGDPEANVAVVPGHRSGRIRRRSVGPPAVGGLRRVRRARGRQRREARQDPGDRRLDQLDPRGLHPHPLRDRGTALRVGRASRVTRSRGASARSVRRTRTASMRSATTCPTGFPRSRATRSRPR